MRSFLLLSAAVVACMRPRVRHHSRLVWLRTSPAPRHARWPLALVLVLIASGCGGSKEAATVTETVTTTTTAMSTATTTVTETVEMGRFETSYEGFQTPSKNIACIVALEAGYSLMTCRIHERDNRPPKRPHRCETEWDGGQFVNMEANSPAGWACGLDDLAVQAFHPDHPFKKLDYRKTWWRGAFECRSLRTGLRCSNRHLDQLFLSRERQTFTHPVAGL
jgi:hypothetical protein